MLQVYTLFKNISAMSVTLFAVGLFFAFHAQAGPVLKLDTTSYAAGVVYAGQVIEHGFAVTNTGDKPLEVHRVRSS